MSPWYENVNFLVVLKNNKKIRKSWNSFLLKINLKDEIREIWLEYVLNMKKIYVLLYFEEFINFLFENGISKIIEIRKQLYNFNIY